MAMLPGAPKRGPMVVKRHGSRLMAHMPGQRNPIDLHGNDVHVHMMRGDQFDPGDGTPPVDIHDAFHHNRASIPPALVKLILDAIERYYAQQNIHERAGALAGLPGMGAPPPMPRAAPPVAMGAAPPQTAPPGLAGLPGVMAKAG